MRRFPASRRHPHFAGVSLARTVTEQAIEYGHAPDLGGHRKPRPDSPNSYWRVEAFRAYADYMATAEFREALARLVQRAEDKRTVILCAEAVPWRCHRQLIADALVVRGHSVRHILGQGSVKEHVLSPAARREGEVLIYAPDAPGRLF